MFIKKTNASLIFTTFFVNVSATRNHVASATDCKEAAVVCVLTFYVYKQHKTNKKHYMTAANPYRSTVKGNVEGDVGIDYGHRRLII